MAVIRRSFHAIFSYNDRNFNGRFLTNSCEIPVYPRSGKNFFFFRCKNTVKFWSGKISVLRNFFRHIFYVPEVLNVHVNKIYKELTIIK